jgi:hypothetical protein
MINYNVFLRFYIPRGMKKGLNTVKFDRCVCKVRSRSGKKANPYAVCNAPVGGKDARRGKSSAKRR